MIPLRRVPASTATTESGLHWVEVDRTSSPVTRSSRGPPVGPYQDKSAFSLHVAFQD
jgi:hypothetical protein